MRKKFLDLLKRSLTHIWNKHYLYFNFDFFSIQTKEREREEKSENVFRERRWEGGKLWRKRILWWIEKLNYKVEERVNFELVWKKRGENIKNRKENKRNRNAYRISCEVWKISQANGRKQADRRFVFQIEYSLRKWNKEKKSHELLIWSMRKFIRLIRLCIISIIFHLFIDSRFLHNFHNFLSFNNEMKTNSNLIIMMKKPSLFRKFFRLQNYNGNLFSLSFFIFFNLIKISWTTKKNNNFNLIWLKII